MKYLKNKISAVVFVYNEEKYISNLIDSINSQTCKVDQIIICDDFSTDNTLKIIKNKKNDLSKNIHIRILNNKQKGKVYAYEEALKSVDTELFFVCAGDDILKCDYVKSMMDFINKYKIDFAYCNQVWVDSDLNFIKYTEKKLFYFINDLIHSNFAGGGIFGYSYIIKQYIPFPKGLTFEDWYVALLLSDKFGKCYINNNKNYLYRRHDGADTFISTRKDKVNLVKRDINFFQLLVDINFYNDIFNNRISFYNSKINKISFINFIKIFTLRNVTPMEKIKLLIIKLTKYYS